MSGSEQAALRPGAARRLRAGSPRRALVLPALLITVDALVLSGWLRFAAAAAVIHARPPGTVAVLLMGVAAVLVLAVLQERSPRAAAVAAPAGALVSIAILARWTLGARDASPGGWGVVRLWDTAAVLQWSTPMTWVVAAAIFLWWRAATHATRPATPRRVRRSVLAAVALLGLLAALSGLTYPVNLGPYVLGVAAAALGAMALSRIDESAPLSSADELGPAWAALVPVAIVMVLGVAAVVSTIVSVPMARAVLDSLRPLPDVLVRLVTLAVLALVETLARLLQPLADLFAQGMAEHMQRLLSETTPAEAVPLAGERTGASHVTLVRLVRGGLAGVLVAAIAVWLARAVRRYTTPEREDELVHRELAMSRGRLRAELAGLLQSVRAGGRRAAERIGRRRAPGVRALYAEFLGTMRHRGVRRPHHATPREFAGAAGASLPAAAAEIGVLTRAYETARYGECEPSEQEMSSIERAWQSIRKAAKAEG